VAKPKKNRRQFLVTLDVPPGTTVEDVRQYIDEAVSVWRGSLYPGYINGDDDPPHPLFDLDGESVKVKAIPKKRKAK